MNEKTKIKTLVVDDTVTYRNILKMALTGIEGIEIIGTASDGIDALEQIEKLQPDLVTLDVEMPLLNGLQTLVRIKNKYPEIGVIMVSGANSAEATISSLGRGALDFISKPDSLDMDSNIKTIRTRLKLIIDAFSSQRSRPSGSQRIHIQTPLQPIRTSVKGFDLLVIGSSTGGPSALQEVLSKLPRDFPAPILIVQHMPFGFTGSLAKSLNNHCKIEVVEISSGEELQPGRAHIVQGGMHTTFKRERRGAISYYCAETNDTAQVNNCRPSIDVTFKSLAECFQGNTLSIILTGMGVDGAEGIRSLKEHGKNYCITQSEESCVVYGMPRVVDNAKLSDTSLHLNNIGGTINQLIGSRDHVASTN